MPWSGGHNPIVRGFAFNHVRCKSSLQWQNDRNTRIVIILKANEENQDY